MTTHATDPELPGLPARRRQFAIMVTLVVVTVGSTALYWKIRSSKDSRSTSIQHELQQVSRALQRCDAELVTCRESVNRLSAEPIPLSLREYYEASLSELAKRSWVGQYALVPRDAFSTTEEANVVSNIVRPILSDKSLSHGDARIVIINKSEPHKPDDGGNLADGESLWQYDLTIWYADGNYSAEGRHDRGAAENRGEGIEDGDALLAQGGDVGSDSAEVLSALNRSEAT